MDEPDAEVDETGLLARDGGGFVLRRDGGGFYYLRLPRVPVNHVEKRVRITGPLFDNVVDVEGISAAG